MNICHHFELGIALTVSCLALSLSGCMPVVEYTPDSSGQYHRSFRLSTEDAEWKRTVESRIQAQIAGQPPDIKGETWPQLWRNWYAGIRKYPGPVWKHSQFKTSEDMVRYMKEQRRAHGLPTYE
jgi:hypothetical protein